MYLIEDVRLVYMFVLFSPISLQCTREVKTVKAFDEERESNEPRQEKTLSSCLHIHTFMLQHNKTFRMLFSGFAPLQGLKNTNDGIYKTLAVVSMRRCFKLKSLSFTQLASQAVQKKI